MRLYWVRHGEMEFPSVSVVEHEMIDRFFNGEHQGPLTERGRDEARRVASHLKKRGIDAIYASPLKRARETADFTAEATGVAVTENPDLVEIRCGRLGRDSRAAPFLKAVQRLPIPERARAGVVGSVLLPMYWSRWLRDTTEGGESPLAVVERLVHFLRELRENHGPRDSIAIFSHGYLIYFFANYLADPAARIKNSVRRPYIRNGSVTQVELFASGRYRIVEYAEHGHLTAP